MTIILQIRRGDVIACKYKQFNQDVKASHHPFVVVSTKGGKIKILVCTDAKHAGKFTNCVKIDYNTCGLRKPTCVICNKYSYISNSDVTTVIGALSAADYRNVISELCKPENNVVKFERWRDLVR